MKKKKLIRISTVPCSLETFLEGQLKRLSLHYEVVAVSSPGRDLEIVSQREGVRAVAIAMERHISILRDLVSLFRLIILFAKERPDIVHSMTPKAGLLAMVAAWVTRVPIRMHTFTGLVFPTTNGFKRKTLVLMDRLTCFCATYINPEGKGVMYDLQRFQITKKSLHVIANGNVRGVKMEHYDRTTNVQKKANTLKEQDVFTFCFIGRLVGDKGINELVVAFDKLHKENTQTRLMLVGNEEAVLDPLNPSTIHLLFNNEAIHMIGHQDDIRPYLATSNAFVFPSYREGFPNVVLEAGAMGLPSIVTDINGCNEIIIPNENGVIIPPRNEDALYHSMKYFIENSEDVARMAKNARPMIASRYEQKMVWNALLEEYTKLTKNTNK